MIDPPAGLSMLRSFDQSQCAQTRARNCKRYKGQSSWIDFHGNIFHCQLTPVEDVKSYLKSRFSLSANMYLTAWCNLR